MTTLRLAITTGEPAGIGPDLVIQLAQLTWPAELVVIADPDLLKKRAQQLGLPLTFRYYDSNQTPQPQQAQTLTLLPIAMVATANAGQLDPANASYVLHTLERAGNGCLQGEFAAVITAPVHKGIINDAGVAFTGHTEFFAALAGCHQVVMMLIADKLRVALATTHLPIAKVADAITQNLLINTIQIINNDLKRWFKIAIPRILVCGLNPHAGEGGHFGQEEIHIISPVLQQLQQQGINCTGPLPADTIFTPTHLVQADAILAMYHDQGLPVLKHVGFGHAVNITLGLPFIRTSVDHGTALDLAGTGRADAGSLKAAIELALQLAQQ